MNPREFMLLNVVVLVILLYALLGKLADSVARLTWPRRWRSATAWC
jgi:hypothetical protein